MGVLGSDVRLGLLLSGQHPAGDSAVGGGGSASRAGRRRSRARLLVGVDEPAFSLASLSVLAECAVAGAGGGGGGGDDGGDRDPVVDAAQPGRGGTERAPRTAEIEDLGPAKPGSCSAPGEPVSLWSMPRLSRWTS